MMGDGLVRGVRGDALGAELFGDGAQERDLGFGERLDALDDRLVAVAVESVGQQDHPFDLDVDALAVERRFAQIFDEVGGLLVVTAIQGGQCDCGGDIGKLHAYQSTCTPRNGMDGCADPEPVRDDRREDDGRHADSRRGGRR